MKKWAFPVLIAAVVIGLVAIFALGGGDKTAPPKPDSQLLGDKHAEGPRTHIAVDASHEPYNSELPSSGSHWATPAPWGVQPTFEADERYVHNLEHGGIWIAYSPSLPDDQKQKLKDL